MSYPQITQITQIQESGVGHEKAQEAQNTI